MLNHVLKETAVTLSLEDNFRRGRPIEALNTYFVEFGTLPVGGIGAFFS